MLKRTQCKNYSKEGKKPIYKRAWLGALAIVIVAGTTGCSDVDNSKEVNSGNVEVAQEVSQDNSENTIAENKSEDKAEDNVPIEYRPVMEKAQFYSNVTNMSKARVYEELTTGCGFTAEEAQYAVDNVKVDWKENALKTAKAAHEERSSSKASMYDRLTLKMFDYEFTPEEAQYAVDNLEVDWKANALEDAKFYQKYMSMSPGEIYKHLTTSAQFTAEEAQYAIENLD